MEEKKRKRGRDQKQMITVSHHHFAQDELPHHLTVSVSEVMQEEYGLYVWPCSIVLADYIWQNRERFCGARVLEICKRNIYKGQNVEAIVSLKMMHCGELSFHYKEFNICTRTQLGAGTALPGIVAAKVGATVILTDRQDQPQVFENMKRTCGLNQVDCLMQGLTWGQWDAKSGSLRHPAQIVIGADVLYDSKGILMRICHQGVTSASPPLRNVVVRYFCGKESRAFDDLFATVKFLLHGMPDSVFITTYQRRSGHRSIEYLMSKWGLQCTQLIDASDFLSPSKLPSLSTSVELVEMRLKKHLGCLA